MVATQISHRDKKDFTVAVGNNLIKKHGKKKFYSPAEIREAAKNTIYNIDWLCWAMCLYSSPPDFKAYHDEIGEVCDYTAMKTEMTSLLTDGESDSWLDFDFDLSWLEWPDIELPSIFDIFD